MLSDEQLQAIQQRYTTNLHFYESAGPGFRDCLADIAALLDDHTALKVALQDKHDALERCKEAVSGLKYRLLKD